MSVLSPSLSSSPTHLLHTVAFQQGNRIPPDQVGRYRDRKKMLDQQIQTSAENIRRACTVSNASDVDTVDIGEEGGEAE